MFKRSTILPKFWLIILLSLPLFTGVFFPNTAQASNTANNAKTLTLDEAFKKICKEKLDKKYHHSFCDDTGLKDFEYEEINKDNNIELSSPARRLTNNDLTALFPNINKLLCFHSNTNVWDDQNFKMIHAWNNHTGKCELAEEPFSITQKLQAIGADTNACSAIIKTLDELDITNTTNTKLLALAFNSLDNCAQLSDSTQKATCEKINSNYKTCLGHINKLSDKFFHPLPTQNSTWEASSELSSFDFYDISLYAKYAYAVLNSCLRSNKTYCQNLNKNIAVNLPSLKANLNFNDYERLTTIIGLIAYGSSVEKDANINTAQVDNLSGVKIGNLPNLLANSWLESVNNLQEIINNKAQSAINFNRSNIEHGKIINFTCSNNNEYQIVRSIETANNRCRLASRLDFLMHQKSDIYSCSYLNSPENGANSLIRFCQADNPDIAKCEIATRRYIDGEAFLHENKTRPIFLETMYWNLIDNGRKNEAQVKWKRLTEEQKKYINHVVANPDTSPYVERNNCSLGTNGNEVQSQAQYDVVCKVEGGLGWAICGAAQGLLNSFDAVYASLSQNLPINTSVASTTSQVGDQTIKTATFTIWQYFVNLANIIVIILLLITIASYLTGYGLNNYQIKVILPKLIVIVLLINLSFAIIQILIDFSNLAGDGLYNTFLELTNLSEVDAKMTAANVQSDFWNRTVWSQALDVIFMAAMGLVWLLSSTLQLFVIAGREIILTIIIITAPIIAVLFALPNTQKITKLWQNGFIFALILYPMITLIFAISRIGFLVTYEHSQDLISGIFARTVLILPLLTSPYLMVKVGKNIPLAKTYINRVANFGRNFLSRSLPEPKPNSWRDFARQRRQHRRDLASRGELTGLSNLINPLRWPNSIRNQMAKRFNREEIFNTKVMASRKAHDRARLEAAELLRGNNDYERILNHYDVGAGRAGKRKSIRPDSNNSAGISKLLAQGMNHQELILSAALAKLQQEQELGSSANIQDFAHALHVARAYGASQAELQAVYNQAMTVFKNSGNFSATGDLKAMAQWNETHPDSNGNTWGGYSESDWNHTATDANGNRNDFTKLRMKTNRSDLIHQVLEQPLDQNGNKITLDSRVMPSGSLAAEVFSNEFNTSSSFEDAIRNQASSFSSQTFGAVDALLNQGLSYNALTANLNANDIADLNAFAAGTLNHSDERRLRDKIFRIQGHHINAATASSSNEIDLVAIQQMVVRSGAFSGNYNDLVGWSFRNVVILPPSTPPSIQTIQANHQNQAQQYSRYISSVVNRNSRYGRNTQSRKNRR